MGRHLSPGVSRQNSSRQSWAALFRMGLPDKIRQDNHEPPTFVWGYQTKFIKTIMGRHLLSGVTRRNSSRQSWAVLFRLGLPDEIRQDNHGPSSFAWGYQTKFVKTIMSRPLSPGDTRRNSRQSYGPDLNLLHQNLKYVSARRLIGIRCVPGFQILVFDPYKFI